MPAPRGGNLKDWLDWQQQLHPRAIDLGLSRISQVLARLDLKLGDARILTIGGTNGKGSCAAAAEALARSAGWRVGCYTSPHLSRYNERIRLHGEPVDDALIVQAFERIEAARQDVSLSYFEFGTLAAFCAFEAAGLDLWVLEVGLGGRLDAVNVLDADVAVVTSVGLDHADWLGTDLLGIAREKLAIGRAGRPLLLGPQMPEGTDDLARSIGARTLRLGPALAHPLLAGFAAPAGLLKDNLSLALLALEALNMLPEAGRIASVLADLRVPGRCERITRSDGEDIYDVAHNVDAVSHLAAWLDQLPPVRSTAIVFAALADKPIEAMSDILDPRTQHWYIAPLPDPRGLGAEALRARMRVHKPVTIASSVEQACEAARVNAQRVVVCGSFLTVGAARHG